MSTRDAMFRLAKQWETTAENLADAVSVPRHPNVLDVLRACAAELRSTLRTQQLGDGPAPDTDLLADVVVGGPDPTHASWEDCNAERLAPSGVTLLCSRMPHPEHWQHIAGDGQQVLAVWFDVEDAE